MHNKSAQSDLIAMGIKSIRFKINEQIPEIIFFALNRNSVYHLPVIVWQSLCFLSAIMFNLCKTVFSSSRFDSRQLS